MENALVIPSDYPEFLEQIKREIGGARSRAALAVNEELLRLYHHIGSEILARQDSEGWGTRVIVRLSVDLRHEFPEMKGLSRSNLEYMRKFAAAWPDVFASGTPIPPQLVGELAIAPQAVAQLPWGHNRLLLDKLDDPAARLWYARSAVEHGWSRNVIDHHISTQRYEREGKALTNFTRTLPEPESELMQQIVHEDYNFEFLGLAEDAKERQLEKGLIADIEDFMLELGSGFAFVGRQVRLQVGEEEFIIDLLFFHIPSNRYVVIDLKLGKYRPSYAGQINFYVTVIDNQRRLPHHDSTIGIVLCTSHDDMVVRYSLEGMNKPLSVARYSAQRELVERIPEELQKQLPEIEKIAAGVREIAAHYNPVDAQASS